MSLDSNLEVRLQSTGQRFSLSPRTCHKNVVDKLGDSPKTLRKILTVFFFLKNVLESPIRMWLIS